MILFSNSHKDPTNELEMLDKALELVQKQYEQKSITLEEFTNKCKEIGKKREKILKKLNK